MTDSHSNHLDAPAAESSFKQAMRFMAFILSALLGLFVIAAAAGFVAGMTQDGAVSGTGAIALGVAVLLLAAVAWLLKRTMPDMALPNSPRMRSNRLLLYVTLALSILLGIALAMLSGKTGASLGDIVASGTPLPQPVALLLLASMLLVTILSIRWHMSLDEHERAAYDFGGIAALYVYFIASVCWWLTWRGGMTPEPDGYSIFALTMIVWAIGWLARRFF